MSKPISLYYVENNQRIILYPNGYGISRIQNMFSHGLEVLVFKWKFRDPSSWEKLRDGFKRLFRIPITEPYYESEDIRGNILKHSSFEGEDDERLAIYSHLTSEQLNEIEEQVAALKELRA
jgi:hypothetical protein